jgi:RNA polymerase sigma-70 factor, ECF subfamily
MRDVLALVPIEGLSYREAAAVLDVPVGTVMSRLARARAELMSRLNLTGDVTDWTLA